MASDSKDAHVILMKFSVVQLVSREAIIFKWAFLIFFTKLIFGKLAMREEVLRGYFLSLFLTKKLSGAFSYREEVLRGHS